MRKLPGTCSITQNDMNIQQILDSKNSFGKNHPVFPKNLQRGFWDTLNFLIRLKLCQK